MHRLICDWFLSYELMTHFIHNANEGRPAHIIRISVFYKLIL